MCVLKTYGVINHCVCQDVVFMFGRLEKIPTAESATCNMKFLFQFSHIARTVVAQFVSICKHLRQDFKLSEQEILLSY